MVQILFQIQDFHPQLLGMLETEGSYLSLLWKLPGQKRVASFTSNYEVVNMGREKPSPLACTWATERSIQCLECPRWPAEATIKMQHSATSVTSPVSLILLTVVSKNTTQGNFCLDISETRGLGFDCTFRALVFTEKMWFISSFIHSWSIFQVDTMSDIVLIATVIDRTDVTPDHMQIAFWWDLLKRNGYYNKL